MWCEATNKWGTVKSKAVALRIPDDERAAQPAVSGSDVRVVLAEQDRIKREHQKKFGGALAQVGTEGAASGKERSASGASSGKESEVPPFLRQGSSIRDNAGQSFSGKL